MSLRLPLLGLVTKNTLFRVNRGYDPEYTLVPSRWLNTSCSMLWEEASINDCGCLNYDVTDAARLALVAKNASQFQTYNGLRRHRFLRMAGAAPARHDPR